MEERITQVDQKPGDSTGMEVKKNSVPSDSKNIIQTKIPSKKIISRKVIIIAACVFLFVVGGGYVFILKWNANTVKVNQLRNDIYQKIADGNYIAAQESAKKAYVQTKDSYFIRKYIDASSAEGNIRGNEGEVLKNTEPYIKELEAKDGQSYDSLISIGYAYETAGEYSKALEYYEKAIKIKETSDAFFHKGHVLDFLDRAAEAKDAYSKAALLDPNNPFILLTNATSLDLQGKTNEALNLYISVADSKKTPSDLRAEAYAGAAILTSVKGNNSLALQYAKAGYELYPDYSMGEGIYGFLSVLNGNLGTGIKLQLDAIKKNPRVTYTYMTLGVSFRSLNYFKEAIYYQKKGVELVMQDNTLLGSAKKTKFSGQMNYELAQTYSLAKDRNNAIIYLNKAIVENPNLATDINRYVKNGYFDFIKNDPEFAKYLANK